MVKNLRAWLEFRRHRYDVFEKPEADLIERITALGYVLVDDETSYKVYKNYGEATCIVQFPRSFISRHSFVTSLLDALATL